MKSSQQQRFAKRVSVIAVQGALALMLPTLASVAYAGDAVSDEVREFTAPENFVEIGVINVDNSSAKFGEYNGLDKNKLTGNAAFEINGGAPETATRWQIQGSDLGLDTRSLNAEYGEQGKYRINFGYDELQRNYADDYKTLYTNPGSSNLVLPGSYPAASTRLSSTSISDARSLSNWGNLQSPNATGTTTGGGPGYIIPPLMHEYDISTKRKKVDIGYSQIFSPEWEFSLTARNEDKEGTKLTGVAFAATSRAALLPEPIDSTTTLWDAGLAYRGKDSNFRVGYSGSLYKNNTDLWTAQNFWQGGAVLNDLARMQGAPDNQMHMLNLAGGYNFTKATKLVVSGSYARLTQDENFLSAPTGGGWSLPANSADAKVINTNFLAKLTSKFSKDLNLLASYRYQDRDNKTDSQTWQASGQDGVINSASTIASNTWTNLPINRRSQNIVLEGDYSLGRGQAIKAGYEWEEIRRTSDAPGDETPFLAETTKENTVKIEYRNTLGEGVTGRIGYGYSQRRHSHYEEGDAYAGLSGGEQTLPGFRQFYLADRNRDKLRTSVNYQASDALSLQAGVDYNKDNYTDGDYGVSKAKSWVLNLDSAYVVSDTLSFNAYYTYEDQSMEQNSLSMGRVGTTSGTAAAHIACAAYASSTSPARYPADFATDPCRNWNQEQADKVHTIGLGFKQAGIAGGKLDLTGDMSYSYSKTPIDVGGGSYVSNGNNATGTINTNYIPAQSFQDITSKIIRVSLTGKYKIDKQSAFRVNYIYQKFISDDWQYDSFTNSSLGVLASPAVLGTGMTSPNNSVNAVGVAYLYSFK